MALLDKDNLAVRMAKAAKHRINHVGTKLNEAELQEFEALAEKRKTDARRANPRPHFARGSTWDKEGLEPSIELVGSRRYGCSSLKPVPCADRDGELIPEATWTSGRDKEAKKGGSADSAARVRRSARSPEPWQRSTLRYAVRKGSALRSDRCAALPAGGWLTAPLRVFPVMRSIYSSILKENRNPTEKPSSAIGGASSEDKGAPNSCRSVRQKHLHNLPGGLALLR